MKRRFVWLAIAALGIALAVLAYRGPGRVIVRGHVGDVAAAMFVYAIVAALLRERGARAAATLAIAIAIELGQIVWHTDSTAGELLIGSTFDPCCFMNIPIAWPSRGTLSRTRSVSRSRSDGTWSPSGRGGLRIGSREHNRR